MVTLKEKRGTHKLKQTYPYWTGIFIAYILDNPSQFLPTLYGNVKDSL